MTSRHLVRRAAEAVLAGEAGWAPGAQGLSCWPVVTAEPAVHTGFDVCELAAGGSVPAHVHSFEESFYVLDGAGLVSTADGTVRVGPGDYGVFPVGLPHAWHNDGGTSVRWAQMQAPQPRPHLGWDTMRAPDLPAHPAAALDVRDPRTRRLGNITVDHMDVNKQGQSHLAVSASMRTALLVYSGITVKMMVDSDLGARLSTMFMVQYATDGVAGQHDHPFEETYLFLEGLVEATFDNERYLLEPGDVAWAGVGCVHSFRNAGDGRVRWLETQAPQPPSRHSYRFARDWEYLAGALGHEGSQP